MCDFSRLQQPFPAEDIEWRMQSCGEKNGKFWGRCLAYVTNRAIQQRLDEVCGPGGWRNEFVAAPLGGILCGLSIKVDNEWVTKWDGAENTDIEAIKGGLSGAMKRAAVQWGIGRYLYKLPEGWADISENGRLMGQTKDKKRFKWNPPQLPAWALPDGAAPRQHSNGEDHRANYKTIERHIKAARYPTDVDDALEDFEDQLEAMPEEGRAKLKAIANQKRQELGGAAVNE